ncbi:hypothetical protein Acsp04_60050 [Actinomadura sp. NBRC 104425]|nr:hypothetical protein Acsp04_60050 [Actinomadura sp. NBRC 104425]
METIDALVIGGGQSGPAAAHALRAAGLAPVIAEASDRPVGSWPRYYDSLTLFSPAATRSWTTCSATPTAWTPTSAPAPVCSPSPPTARTTSPT